MFFQRGASDSPSSSQSAPKFDPLRPPELQPAGGLTEFQLDTYRDVLFQIHDKEALKKCLLTDFGITQELTKVQYLGNHVKNNLKCLHIQGDP